MSKKWKLENPKRLAYINHKARAKYRGIPFNLTYYDWLGMWGDKISKKGLKHNQFCMSRFGDNGPYSVDNVRIVTNSENHKEWADSARRTADGSFLRGVI